MNVIVIGGGKVGFYLCKTLLEHGHQPLIIEKNKRTCEYASTQLDIPTINADGSTIEALTAANASRSDAVIAVTGLDQDNLISCQLAKEIFHVPKTVARVNNPKNAAVMKKLGVDIPISSTDNIARLLEREVDTARIKALLSLNRGEASLNELQIPDNYPLSGKRLFELEVPEIFDGTVEIRSIAREAGSRTKMAVWSADENVDPIGACVGPRGQRVAAIVEELHGEKIDIIKYSEDPAEFIAAALAPSDVEEVRLADEGKVCRVIVPDDQLSLAIGKEGQNARLAARLTGYKIDIKPVSRADE